MGPLGLFLLGMTRAYQEGDRRRIIHGILAVGTVVAFVGIAQKGGGLGSEIYGLWPRHYSSDSLGPFTNSNHFAGWMLMAIPLVLGYLCARVSQSIGPSDRNWRARLQWLSSRDASQIVFVAVGILLMALSLVMTRSRAGITCFALALAVFGGIVARTERRRLRRTLVVASLLSIFALSTTWAGGPAIAKFIETPALDGRAYIWLDTLRVIRQFPLVGTGLNTYSTVATFQQIPGISFVFVHAHNDYLQFVAEGGLLLGAAAAILLLLFVKEVMRRFRECVVGSTDYWIRVGAVTGLISIGLQEFVDCSLQIPGNAALFVVLCSLAVHTAPRLRTHSIVTA